MQEVKTEYRYESITEYDIDEPKRYDMKFGSTKQLVLMGYEGEKYGSFWHPIRFPRFRMTARSGLTISGGGLTWG